MLTALVARLTVRVFGANQSSKTSLKKSPQKNLRVWFLPRSRRHAVNLLSAQRRPVHLALGLLLQQRRHGLLHRPRRLRLRRRDLLRQPRRQLRRAGRQLQRQILSHQR